MKRILLSIFTLVLLNSISAQTVVFSEDFNYSSAANGDSMASATTGNPIWNRHSGGTSVAKGVAYSTTPLTYTGYSGSGVGGSIMFQHTTRSQDINGNIGTADSVGSVYASFLLRIDTAGGKDTLTDYFFHFLDGAGTTPSSNFRCRLFACNGSDSSTKFKLGLCKGTNAKLTATQITAGAKAPIFTTGEYNIGQTYLVVVKYTFGTVAKDDTMRLFVFASGSLPVTEPTADITAIDGTISDLARISSVCIRQGSIGKTAGSIDAIRVFTTWDAATITALPVRLLSFNASKNENGTAKVWWNVNGDDDVVNYVVEKSLNGKEFNSFGNVKANNKNNYELVDNNVLTATTYYRVKFVSKNGTATYSNIVSVTPLKSVKLDVFPNPVQNNLVISYPKLNGDANIFVTTIDGKNIMSVAVKANTTQSSIDISNLNKGNYIVTFLDAEGNKTSKTIIKN